MMQFQLNLWYIMQVILVERQGSSVCDVITLVKFLSVGLLLVNCRLTVGILPADSIPTVGRQVFWGALLHNYRFLLIYLPFPVGICKYFSSARGQPWTDASFVFLSGGFGEFEAGPFTSLGKVYTPCPSKMFKGWVAKYSLCVSIGNHTVSSSIWN